MHAISRLALALVAASLLHGCDDTDAFSPGTPEPEPSDASFPFAQAFADFIAASHAYGYAATGSDNITGAGTMAFGAATGATFEGQAALSRIRSVVGTLTANGTTIPDTLAGRDYYTTNYDPLGSSDINGDIYCVANGAPAYPSIAEVGDAATIATYNCYEDSTKTTLISEDTQRYSVGADTASTAIIEIVTLSELQNILQITVRDRYRITETGGLEWISLAVTDETVSPAAMLTYTAQ